LFMRDAPSVEARILRLRKDEGSYFPPLKDCDNHGATNQRHRETLEKH
jgi:hypothetical protein